MLMFFPTDGLPEKDSWGSAVYGYGSRLPAGKPFWNTPEGVNLSNTLTLNGAAEANGGFAWVEDGWFRIHHTSTTNGADTLRFYTQIDSMGPATGTLIFGHRIKVSNYTGQPQAAICRLYTTVSSTYHFVNLLFIEDVNDGKEHYAEFKYITNRKVVEVYLDDLLLRTVTINDVVHQQFTGNGSRRYIFAGGASSAMNDQTNFAGDHYMRDMYLLHEPTDLTGETKRLGPIRLVPLDLVGADGDAWSPVGAPSNLDALNTPLAGELETPVSRGDDTAVDRKLSLSFGNQIGTLDKVTHLVVGGLVSKASGVSRSMRLKVGELSGDPIVPGASLSHHRLLMADKDADGNPWTPDTLKTLPFVIDLE